MLSKIKSTLIGLVYFFLSCLKLEKLKSSVIQVKSEKKNALRIGLGQGEEKKWVKTSTKS